MTKQTIKPTGTSKKDSKTGIIDCGVTSAAESHSGTKNSQESKTASNKGKGSTKASSKDIIDCG